MTHHQNWQQRIRRTAASLGLIATGATAVGAQQPVTTAQPDSVV